MGGGKVAMDITLPSYTQDIRVLGIWTPPPPTSLGLATPLDVQVIHCILGLGQERKISKV